MLDDPGLRWPITKTPAGAMDPAVRWQVARDISCDPDWPILRENSQVDGWCAYLMSHRAADGRWAGGLYSPKWTSTF